MMKEAPTTEWADFTRSLIHDFGPPTSQETQGDLTPSHHNDDLNDCIDAFTAYVVRVGISNDLHQVHLFINGLQHRPREAVIQHQPQEMEAAILHVRALEDLEATPFVTPQVNVESDTVKEQHLHTPTLRVDKESTPATPTMTPTTHTPPARALMPWFGYNSAAMMCAH